MIIKEEKEEEKEEIEFEGYKDLIIELKDKKTINVHKIFFYQIKMFNEMIHSLNDNYKNDGEGDKIYIDSDYYIFK
jgi:hypothetical protein